MSNWIVLTQLIMHLFLTCGGSTVTLITAAGKGTGPFGGPLTRCYTVPMKKHCQKAIYDLFFYTLLIGFFKATWFPDSVQLCSQYSFGVASHILPTRTQLLLNDYIFLVNPLYIKISFCDFFSGKEPFLNLYCTENMNRKSKHVVKRN